jgi:hypothetical protein
MINTIRSQPAPLSLADQKTYRTDEVLTALFVDFKQKCYLTEYVFHDMGLMDIDHFSTQSEASHLKFDWANLYPIHSRANQARPRRTPEGGYLDPCNFQDDVEQNIIYQVRFDGTPVFKARDQNNQKAVNTAELLTRVHKNFKGAIGFKQQEVENELKKWSTAIGRGELDRVLECESILKSLFSRNSLYTMLMRSIDNAPAEFFD